ncbi:MAG: hypothetical protein LBT01_07925 [Spirochaetaceae bacterium]|nr:hypothetical protein [Spirochaetaceae bacterium]
MKKICAPVLGGFFLLFVSCAAMQDIIGKTPFATSTKPEEAPEIPEVPYSSRSFEEMFEVNYWVTRPSQDGIMVIGVAGRQSNKDNAIAAALSDAARRVSLYHGLSGESVTVINQGSGALDYYADKDYKIIINNKAEDYIESLSFDKETDVFEKNGAVYVRTRYAGVSSIPDYHSELMEDGRPTWVRDFTIEIPDYLTSVGISRNKGTPQKTHEASYENAIIGFLPQLWTETSNTTIEAGGAKLSLNQSVSRGALKNVMILETWIDVKRNEIWTLAVAKKN